MHSFLRTINFNLQKSSKSTTGLMNTASRHHVTRKISSGLKHEVELLKTSRHSLELKPLENKEKNWPLLLDLWYHFHENAPTCAGVTGFRTPEGRAILELCLRDMILSADCPVVIAWDTEKTKVAAMCINHIDRRDEQHIPYHERPGTFKYENHIWPEETQKDITLLKHFYEHNIARELDFFQRYKVDACWTPSPTSVLPEYADQSILLRMVQYSMAIGKRMGLRMMKGMCESIYAQNMARRIGGDPVVECNYELEFQLYHKMPGHLRKKHKSCMAMVKVL